MTINPKLVAKLALTLTIPCAFAAPKTYLANDYGAKGDGTTLETAAIQKAIEAAATTGGKVTLKPGTYLIGSLFPQSGITSQVPEGVTPIGPPKLQTYPPLPPRLTH